jgi:hypothetical protein
MKVLFNELEEAFYDYGEESSFWIDKRNGDVIFIADESIVGELDYGDKTEAVYQIKILTGEIETEDEIEIEENSYIKFLPTDSDEKWKWMEEFTIKRIEDIELQNKLVNALRGRKPFRKFKDVLIFNPTDEQKWFDFEKEKMREYTESWARDEGFEIDFADEKE